MVDISLLEKDDTLTDPYTDSSPLESKIDDSSGNRELVIYVSDGDTSKCTDNLADNALILRLTNTTLQPLCPTATEEQAQKAYFTISFFYGDDEKGSVCKPSDISQGFPTPEVGRPNKDDPYQWEASPDSSGPMTQWNFTPVQGNTELLGTEDSNCMVQFALSKIVSNLPEGKTRFYLTWNNIPGYNDDLKIFLVHKEPAQPTVKKFSLSKNPYTAYIDPLQQQAYFEYNVYGAHDWNLTIKGYNDDNPKILDSNRNGKYADPNLPAGSYTATLEPSTLNAQI